MWLMGFKKKVLISRDVFALCFKPRKTRAMSLASVAHLFSTKAFLWLSYAHSSTRHRPPARSTLAIL